MARDTRAKIGNSRGLLGGRGVIARHSVAGQSLTVTIAIMTFLASLAVCAVAMVKNSADRWQSDIAGEVTVQIKSADSRGMDETVRETSRLLLGFEGIAKVTALDDASAASLLEPWLGAGLDLKQLPVPKLLIVTLRSDAKPDFAAIRAALEEKSPGAYLDDHRGWSSRLTQMAWASVGFGTGVLILMLCATVLTVIFATRGAMASNREVVDVLYTVGARPEFIAREFQAHFLTLAMRGALAGAVAATLLFVFLGVWIGWSRQTPQGEQLGALFGSFSPGLSGYGGIVAVAFCVSALVAATSHLTVLSQLATLDQYRGFGLRR